MLGYTSHCLAMTVGPDAATIAWVNAVIANGGTVSVARQSLVDSLITGLKSDGVWSKFDRLWIFSAENTPSALTDLVGRTLATASNSPTFTTDRGYTFNGTTNFVDTKFAPSAGVQYTQNLYHLSIWLLASDTSGDFKMATGTFQGTNEVDWTYRTSGGSGAGWSWLSDGDGYRIALGVTTGHFIGCRTGSTTFTAYVNGAVSGGTIGSSTAQTPSTNSFYVGGENAGSLSNPGAHQIAFVSMGNNLSSTDASNFYTRLRTYMTAVGVP